MPGSRPRFISLRQLIWLIAIAPTVIAGGIVLLLSEHAASRIADDLADRYVTEAQGRVGQQINTYLRSAVTAGDLFARRIERGELDTLNLDAWLAPALDQIRAMPDIASVTFGTPDGRCFWVARVPAGFEIALLLDPSELRLAEYVIDADRSERAELLRTTDFDPRARPWYVTGTNNTAPTWTDVYTWVNADQGSYMTSLGHVRQVRDNNGDFLGVLSIDVTLGAISDFLAAAPVAGNGTLLLADANGTMIGASHAPVLDADGERLTVTAALDAIDASAPTTTEQPSITRHATGEFRGEPTRFATSPMNIEGLDGLTLTVAIPEQQLLAGTRETRHRLFLAGITVIAITAGLSFFITSAFSRRLAAVRDHVRAVSEGKFESRLDDSGPSEWRTLASELNTMASDLETFLETQKGLEVAMEVQQALLPESIPSPKGLQVAGHCKYCDATGGDYYDFLEYTQTGPTGLLVAVGDVMGHGVAAALLMATARAALRAHAPTQGSLGPLMTRVNELLAADARHGRFMTLSLLVVEPEDRSVRWASAGHDPAIVVDPATGDISELEGGDIPLGLVEGVQYDEYRRENLPPGALILLGTDGIWEMANEAGTMYGKERLFHLLAARRHTTPQEISDAIDADLIAFRGGAPVLDDVTFIIAKLP